MPGAPDDPGHAANLLGALALAVTDRSFDAAAAAGTDGSGTDELPRRLLDPRLPGEPGESGAGAAGGLAALRFT